MFKHFRIRRLKRKIKEQQAQVTLLQYLGAMSDRSESERYFDERSKLERLQYKLWMLDGERP